MNDYAFLTDLAVVIALAGAAALICQWLKQPRVIGYILAGIFIGLPTNLTPVLTNQASIHTLAELGLIFLLFSLGLDFNLRKLRDVGFAALGIAVVDVAVMLWLGYMIGQALGWNLVESLFLGAIICDSSTAIVAKMLGETDQRREAYAKLILGTTIVEDLLAVVLIALLTAIGISGNVQASMVFSHLGSLAVFLVVLIVGGLLFVPRLLNIVGRSRSDELLIVTVTGLCFAVVLLGIQLDFSLALSAFVIGAIMSESRQHVRIEMLTDPLRDVFAAVFFVAVGLLVNLQIIYTHIGALLLLTCVVILAKFTTCSIGAFVMGNDRDTAVRMGCGMAQVNEFALIIAALGVTLNVTREVVYPLAVGVAVLTTFINPYILRHADIITRGLDAVLPRSFQAALANYTQWASRFEPRDAPDAVRKAVKRCLMIIMINAGWIAAIFIITAYLARRFPYLLAGVPAALGGPNAIFWFGAALAIIPFLVASLRKLQALGMILAEIKFPQAPHGSRISIPRMLTELAVLLSGCVALILFVLMLSSAILPPWPVLLLLILVIALITSLMWTFNIRIYAKAQTALREVFAGAHEWFSLHPIGAMAYFFKDARLGSVVVVRESRVVDKIVRELNLRAQTGATIIGIERQGIMIINPEADETFQPGDRVMLLGTGGQIENARAWLSEHPAGESGAGR
ncbi:MAG: cation:proton antiporter [Kiritimatiellae bacterium]|nr:cation:proton antiporter [Kiritimatiellia bacterium]